MKRHSPKIVTEKGKTSGGHFGEFRHNKKFIYDKDGEDNGPSRESMRKRYQTTWHFKTSDYSASAILRFINANVGMPWSKVYSELNESFKNATYVAQDAMRWVIKRNVCTNAFYNEDNNLVYQARYNYANNKRILPVKKSWDFYVDPKTKILMGGLHSSKGEWRNYKETNHAARLQAYSEVCRWINPHQYIYKENGQWFRIEIVDNPIDRRVQGYNGWWIEHRRHIACLPVYSHFVTTSPDVPSMLYFLNPEYGSIFSEKNRMNYAYGQKKTLSKAEKKQYGVK